MGLDDIRHSSVGLWLTNERWVRGRNRTTERRAPVLFPTMSFALFFVVVLGVAWRLNDRPKAWKLFMLGASYVFYGAWDWRFLGLIIGSSLINALVAKAMEPRYGAARRAWLVVGLAANLGTLGYFKYYEFFSESLVRMLSPFGLEPHGLVKSVALPVAISFFTFQGISYIVDVFRGDERTFSVLDVSLYLAFFPQLVAGPIVRTSEFMPELHHRRNPDGIDVARAVRLIGRGLIKKVVIASFMAELVDPVFAAPGGYTAFTVFVAILAYAIQIYADFSGYTDIAIGIALLLGFHFPDKTFWIQPIEGLTCVKYSVMPDSRIAVCCNPNRKCKKRQSKSLAERQPRINRTVKTKPMGFGQTHRDSAAFRKANASMCDALTAPPARTVLRQSTWMTPAIA